MRRMSVAFVVVVLAMGFAGRAGAIDTMGIGAQPCRVFLAEQDGPRRNEFMAWILGYLSGLAVERNQDMLADQTADSVMARATELCRRDPEQYLDDVLDDF